MDDIDLARPDTNVELGIDPNEPFRPPNSSRPRCTSHPLPRSAMKPLRVVRAEECPDVLFQHELTKNPSVGGN